MIIYLVVFYISIVSTYIAEKIKKKPYFMFFSAIAILIPSILAGTRGERVGTDINYYAKYCFDLAIVSENINGFLSNNSLDIENGYLLFTYLISIFTDNFQIFLFITQLIINSCVYFFIYSNKEKVPMYFSMSIFLLFFYNISLNIMRQSLALSIFLCSLIFINKRKYIKTIIAFLISLTFHSSVVLALPVYFLLLIATSSKMPKKTKITFFLIIILVVVVFSFTFQYIIYFLSNDLKIIPQKYNDYLYNDYYDGANYDFDVFILIYKMFWCIIAIIAFMRNTDKEKNDDLAYCICLIIDFIIFILSAKITNINRVGYYYAIPAMLTSIPTIKVLFKKDNFNQMCLFVIVLMLLLSYWYVAYVHFNMNETYPYIFFFE